MRDRGTLWMSALLAAVVLLAWPTPAVGQADDTKYVANDVGQLSGGSGMQAYGLNNFGQVVGNAPVADDQPLAWHWETGNLVDIGGLIHFTYGFPELAGEAYDVSDADQIVGGGWFMIQPPWLEDKIPILQAYVTRAAPLTDFGTPRSGDSVTELGSLVPGANNVLGASCAIAISNLGHVVGWADIDLEADAAGYFETTYHGFLVLPEAGSGYYRDTAPADQVNDLLVDLGTLAADDYLSSATGVNDAGMVVGYSYGRSSGLREAYTGFLINPADSKAGPWANLDGNGVNSLMIDLGEFPSTNVSDLGAPRIKNSWARDVNYFGYVVGEADTDNYNTHAFVIIPTAGGEWFQGPAGTRLNNLMIDLGTLGGDNSSAAAVNDAGQIVGWAEDANGQRRACLWEPNGNGYEIVDLNERLILSTRWKLVEARDINEKGEIVGWGTVSSGSDTGSVRGFLLKTATEEQLGQAAAMEDPEDDGGAAGGGGGSPLNLAPIFSDNSAPPSPNNDDAVAPPPAAAPVLCGFGMVSFLPFMLAGLVAMKRRV
jgi:probable HAF family extracellular repeat protein